MVSLLIIGILVLAALAKWLFEGEREKIDLQLTPEQIELYREYFDFEDEAVDFEEMRRTNPHIWMDDTAEFE